MDSLQKFYADGELLVDDRPSFIIEGEMDKSNIVGISSVVVNTGIPAGSTYDVKCQFCMY
jgi:hypothetical protein